MKIVFLLATADAVGGTEIVTRAYAEALARGDEVAILSVYRTSERDVSIANVDSQFLIDASLGQWRPLIDLGVSEVDAERLAGIPSEVVPDEWDSQFNRLSDLALERALSALSCQVIVTTSPALLALAVRFRRANVRIFHQEHRASEFRRGSMLPLARHGPSTNGVGFLTEASRDFFDGLWGSGAPPLHVLTNPVTDEFRPRSTLEERAVIMAARLVPEKQIEHAVVAFWEATQRLPGWQLRVFGEGPHRRRLRRLIQALHVEDRVLLLGSTTTMHLEWARGSIALLTSRFEGFSLALAEAQTAGLPIVSYDSPNGPREIVRDGIDGRLVPLNDRRALAASLRGYMEDADSRRDAGNAARAMSGRFSVVSATVRLRRALETALEDRSTSWHRVAAASITTLAHEPARDPGVSGEELPVLGRHSQTSTVRDANADLLAEKLDEANVPFLVARASSWAETRVVVATDQRARATRALTATLGRFVVDETAPHVAKFFLPHAALGGSWTLGEEYACLVEFWDVVDGNRLSRPGSKPISTIRPDLDATVLAEHGTGQRLTLAALLHRPPEAVDGPIDIVYTWVDGSEDNWLKRRARYSGESPVGATNDERFRQQDELRFSLRSVENFAPWVRHVWIVTDAQVPRWLKPGDPDVTIVDHREIAPFPDALPVFNSHAIEAWLHRIPGISANFIYMNDDVFFGRPVTPEQFFLPGGVCKVFPSPTSLPGRRDPDAQLPHFAAALNGLDLLTERFGKAQYTTFLHTPHALSSGLLAEIAQEFPVDWAATARSRWRSNSDLSVVSFLHHVFGLMTGRAVVSEISSAFVNPSLFDHLPRLAGLRERKRDVFCINDYGKGEIDYEGRRRLVERFLRDYYPLRSALEASGAI